MPNFGRQQQESQDLPRSRSSSFAFIQSRLQRLRLSATPESSPESSADIRGPVGLNLLHEPSETRVDFIFIHGLAGGSRKSWSHGPDRALYWPKEWLPLETGFKHVRIHSYGYNSDWAGRKQSALTIHDFGQSLLADISNAPQLRECEKTPIVFVAHSMGGLVAKKAYLLATRDPMYEDIARRIHTIYFLGTPHRGGDSAQLLKSFVSATVGIGEKAFLEELFPGSLTLQAINDEFRHACGGVNIWSFFEGRPTSIGPRSSILVDRESAVIGLPGEHTQFLDADHRHICKFESPADPNYIVLHRSFMTTIEDIQRRAIFRHQDEYNAQMRIVSSLLGVDQRPEAELLSVTEKQHHGSCTWVTNHGKFHKWLEDPQEVASTSPGKESALPSWRRVLWLSGRPGTGKSVCAGHVIKFLDECNVDCCFYFFREGDKEHSTISQLLRSLAFQMAARSSKLREVFLAMSHNNERISKDDHNLIWSTLFIGRLFRADSCQTHVWVIDALDECSQKGLTTLVQMLSKLDERVRLRVFITSRPGGHVERLLKQDNASLLEIKIGTDDSLRDIEAFVRTKWSHVENQGLISEVLLKSNGVFLWASLIMARMEEVYSIEEMEEVIHQLPSEMNQFYSRIIESLASSQSAEIAKCILKWVICSPRGLTTHEITEMVRLDINRTLTASSSQLEALCGHLIAIDKRTSKVQVLHQTITSYLTRDPQKNGPPGPEAQPLSFWISRSGAHARAAELCLTRLNGKEFSPPKTRRATITGSSSRISPFSEYAQMNFSYHLARSSSTLDAPLVLLSNFLKTNILSWIEMTARTGSLSLLMKTAENLRSYLGRLAKYRPPLGSEVQLVEAWINDLVHIAIAFGPNLLDSPPAIHFIVPLLSPTSSAIHKQFARPSKTLKIKGSNEMDWDDRISCFVYPTDALAIAVSSQFLAVGLADGDINIYSSDNFELFTTLQHGQQVRHLAFGKLSTILVSCSPRLLKLWDKRYNCIWTTNLDTIPLDLTFSSDDSTILLPSKESSIRVFSAVDGSQKNELLLFSDGDSDSSDEDSQAVHWTPPSRVQISPDQRLAALLYRSSAISIWDIERCEKIGVFEKEGCEDVYGAPQALDAVFNPIPELELLAIAYKDGDLITCNPWTLEQVSLYEISVQIIAASPDGRTLVTGDNLGVIHLFFFETLRPIYRISALEDRIIQIVFASDNLRFFDVRANSCNVWEPSVLVRRESSDDSSSEPLSEELPPQYVGSVCPRMFEDGRVITATAQTARGEYLFCGRDDGSIDVIELARGVVIKSFTYHAKGASISHLHWNDEKLLLLSVDLSSRVIVSRFSVTANGKLSWELTSGQLDQRTVETISQVLIAPDCSMFLISTANGDHVRSISDGRILRSESVRRPGKSWFSHPMNISQLVLAHDTSLHIYDWNSFERLTPSDGISIRAYNQKVFSPLTSSWHTRVGSQHLLEILETADKKHRQAFLVDSSLIQPNESMTKVESIDDRLLSNMRLALGFFKSSFFFLDMKGWICSINTKAGHDINFYTRHFFIPRTWQFGAEQFLHIVSKTSVAFAHQEDLVVFHGFLEFEEKVFMKDMDRG